MIIYSVTVTIEAAIEREWLDWMQRVHVPDVLRTGCFTGATIYKMFEPTSDEQTYVIQYQCSAMAEYQRYRDHFAAASYRPPALQAWGPHPVGGSCNGNVQADFRIPRE